VNRSKLPYPGVYNEGILDGVNNSLAYSEKQIREMSELWKNTWTELWDEGKLRIVDLIRTLGEVGLSKIQTGSKTVYGEGNLFSIAFTYLPEKYDTMLLDTFLNAIC
jgi:hypothetical protein